MKFLEKQECPVTTEQVANAAEIAWHTTQVSLLKISGREKG